MNKTEYDLRKENLQLKMAIAELQSNILQRQHVEAKIQLDELLITEPESESNKEQPCSSP